MAQITFESFVVGFKAGGIEGEIDLADIPLASIEYALDYGMRRVVQDFCNSQRHADAKAAWEALAPEVRAKNKEKDWKAARAEAFDMGPVLEARLAAIKEGKLGERQSPGPRVDDVTRRAIGLWWEDAKKQLARDQVKAITGLDTKERNAKVLAMWEGLTDAVRTLYVEDAADAIETERKRAERRAAAVADLGKAGVAVKL